MKRLSRILPLGRRALLRHALFRPLSKRYQSTQPSSPSQGPQQRSLVPRRPPAPPSRKQFVASSTSLLKSLELNLKWLLIRQNRPFNTDDLSAFVSWFVWSNILWLALGTTTFVSLLLYALKSFSIDDCGRVSFVDTLILGALFRYDPEKIVFKFHGGDNVVPNFRKGVISLRNITLESKNVKKQNNEEKKTQEKSQTIQSTQIAQNTETVTERDISDQDPGISFSFNIDKFDLTLNFNKWYQGKGLINDIEVDGVHGSVDNNLDVHIAPGDRRYLGRFVPTLFKNSGYEFNTIKLQNVHVQYRSRALDKPWNLAIFNLEFPKLRLDWFLLDALKPKICSGSLNDSLFTIHQKQLTARNAFAPAPSARSSMISQRRHSSDALAASSTAALYPLENTFDVPTNGSLDSDNTITRLQVHALDIKRDPLLSKYFNWLTDGKANLICDINLPSEKDFNVNELIEELKSKVNKVNKDYLGIDFEELAISESATDEHKFFNLNNLFHEARIFDDLTSATAQTASLPDNLKNNISDSKSTSTMLATAPETMALTDPKLSIFENNKINIKPLTAVNRDYSTNSNRYVFFNLRIQFINPVAKIPNVPPTSALTGKPYISLSELKPAIALVNNNNPSALSFIMNHSPSILAPTDGSSEPVDPVPSESPSTHTQLSPDKQLTLSASVIYNLDSLYGKLSLVETLIPDLVAADLYDTLLKNLHYELNNRLLNSYGNYYNFNLTHLVNALSKNALLGGHAGSGAGEESGEMLFGVPDVSSYSFKISLLVLLGLGALF